MEKSNEAQLEDAKRFGEFFMDLMDNNKDTLLFYLADNALLDWFGHTIKGTKNIRSFFQYKAGSFKHHMETAVSVQKIGYRESHQIKVDSISRSTTCDKLPRRSNNEVTPSKCITPPKQTLVGEHGQGDGPHNDNYEAPKSPTKRRRLDPDNNYAGPPPEVKYFSTKGTIEFHKSSKKKFQTENKWNRPCSLEVAYSGDNFENCILHMILYRGNMKCRRNLLKEFEASDLRT